MTLRKMAEAFSDDGVPVFLVDVKGDLSGFGASRRDAGQNCRTDYPI